MTNLDTRFMTVHPVTFRERCGTCANALIEEPMWKCGVAPTQRGEANKDKGRDFDYCINERETGKCGPVARLWEPK